jgi:hypothetical protein
MFQEDYLFYVIQSGELRMPKFNVILNSEQNFNILSISRFYSAAA